MSGVTTSFLSAWNSLSNERFRPFALWERVGEDMELLRELVEMFSVEYPRLMREIESAVRDGDSKRLEKASHKLKGSLLQFAAPLACEAAANLESASGEITSEIAGTLISKLKIEVDSLVDMLRIMISERPA